MVMTTMTMISMHQDLIENIERNQKSQPVFEVHEIRLSPDCVIMVLNMAINHWQYNTKLNLHEYDTKTMLPQWLAEVQE